MALKSEQLLRGAALPDEAHEGAVRRVKAVLKREGIEARVKVRRSKFTKTIEVHVPREQHEQAEEVANRVDRGAFPLLVLSPLED